MSTKTFFFALWHTWVGCESVKKALAGSIQCCLAGRWLAAPRIDPKPTFLSGSHCGSPCRWSWPPAPPRAALGCNGSPPPLKDEMAVKGIQFKEAKKVGVCLCVCPPSAPQSLLAGFLLLRFSLGPSYPPAEDKSAPPPPFFEPQTWTKPESHRKLQQLQ